MHFRPLLCYNSKYETLLNIVEQEKYMEKHTITIRTDRAFAQKLKHIAAAEDRSVNKQALRILQDFVDRYEAEHGEISTE